MSHKLPGHNLTTNIKRRAQEREVRSALERARSWAHELFRHRSTDTAEQIELAARGKALEDGQVWEAAKLASDIALYNARLMFEEDHQDDGLLHLYIDLLQYLLVHGVVLDSAYQQLAPVWPESGNGAIDSATAQRQGRHRNDMLNVAEMHPAVGAWQRPAEDPFGPRGFSK